MRAIFLFILLCVFSHGTAQAVDKDHFDVGETLPLFTLKVVNEDEVAEKYIALDRYYGNEAKEQKKAILLSFFATYCEPCKREIPFLQALYDAYKDKGFTAVSVTIDKEPEKVDFAKNLAKQHGVKFPVLSDRFNIVAKRYFIAKLPCVYILDSEGKVALVNIGYSDDVSKLLFEKIRLLVGESSTAPIPANLARFFAGSHATTTNVAAEKNVPEEPITDKPPTTTSEEPAADADKMVDKSKNKKQKVATKKRNKKNN